MGLCYAFLAPTVESVAFQGVMILFSGGMLFRDQDLGIRYAYCY